MTEAIGSIQARIAAIQYRFGGATAPMGTQSPASGAASSTSATTSTTATDFASLLEQVTASASTSTETVAELHKYGNGKIPNNALTSLGVGDHKLAAPAAQQFKEMAADAARSGVKIGVNDSYRSYDEQVAMAKSKGLYSQGGLAAKPGTSDHGWGTAVDLQLDSKALTWMKANASKYQFVNNVAGESWHWTYKGQ